MAKQLAFDMEARDRLRAGVDKIARAVASTLGPKGRCAILDKSWGGPTITKDGVTVADEIELEDPYENMAAQMVKEAASRTNKDAGDGTTTATVLAKALVDEGMKLLAAGAHGDGLLRGMRKAVDVVIADLTKRSRKIDIKDKKELEQIATISANNDSSVGKMLADALNKVGADGVITIEEGKSQETTVEVVEGMQFDRGYLSSHFVTNVDRLETEFERPYILLHQDKLSSAKDLGAAARDGEQVGSPAADHRRGRRGRGARDAGREQAARHPERVRGQGAGLRRPSQGHAGRHRGPITGGTVIAPDMDMDVERITTAQLWERLARSSSRRITTTIVIRAAASPRTCLRLAAS